MRKDSPPKLDKSDPNNSKFNLDNLKDKASIIKDKNSRIISENDSRPPKLGKSDEFKGQLDKTSVIKDSNNNIEDSRHHKLGKSDDLKDKNFIVNNRITIGVIGLIIIIIAAALITGIGSHKTIIPNKTNNTTNPATVNQNHFDNGIISFDYPLDWKVLNQQAQPPLIVTVQKDPNNSFSVFNEVLGNTSFAELIIQWRQSILQNGQITYEGNFTMDGVNGYDIEATYNNTTTSNNTIYNTRGIAIDKNQTAYFIIFTFNTTSLNYKDQMDQVINSFHVK